jgi:hypothetical protein
LSALTDISDQAFADLILSFAGEHNRKVVLILHRVSELLEKRGVVFSEEAFALRFDWCLADLVARGALRGFGDLQNWRFSEVCLPD